MEARGCGGKEGCPTYCKICVDKENARKVVKQASRERNLARKKLHDVLCGATSKKLAPKMQGPDYMQRYVNELQMQFNKLTKEMKKGEVKPEHVDQAAKDAENAILEKQRQDQDQAAKNAENAILKKQRLQSSMKDRLEQAQEEVRKLKEAILKKRQAEVEEQQLDSHSPEQLDDKNYPTICNKNNARLRCEFTQFKRGRKSLCSNHTCGRLSIGSILKQRQGYYASTVSSSITFSQALSASQQSSVAAAYKAEVDRILSPPPTFDVSVSPNGTSYIYMLVASGVISNLSSFNSVSTSGLKRSMSAALDSMSDLSGISNIVADVEVEEQHFLHVESTGCACPHASDERKTWQPQGCNHFASSKEAVEDKALGSRYLQIETKASRKPSSGAPAEANQTQTSWFRNQENPLQGSTVQRRPHKTRLEAVIVN